MIQKNYLFKAFAIPFAMATALQFTACGDNPIEVENEKQLSFSSAEVSAALDSISAQRANVDLYTCLQQSKDLEAELRQTRCQNFIAKYQPNTELGTIIKMVNDTDNYNDNGLFIGAHYLVVNKVLNMTLESFKQLKESISDSKELSDPEVRFFVKTYIDGEESGYEQMSSPIVLDTTGVKKWEGTKAVTVQIPRGIDGLEICPIVRDRTETEYEFVYEDLIADECIQVKDIGYIEDRQSSEESTATKAAEIKWKWFLYETNE